MNWEFKSIPNVRDIGGYKMHDGRTIKHNRLLRGGFLKDASEEDILYFQKIHLRHIFDFRTEGEVSYKPDCDIPGADNLWLPTLDMHTDQKIEQFPAEAYRNLPDYLMTAAFTDKGKETARTLYPSMVVNEYTQLQYSVFIMNVLNTNEGACYWHCSEGKDRTGLGAAFLLAALGADMDIIIEDFDKSNDYYQERIDIVKERIEAIGGGEEEMKVIQAFIGVSVENFINAMKLIDSEYGSMEDYLHNQLLLSDDDITTLRNKYLE